ncbi:hypothetical protein H8959_022068 [Pygathrix nigripes]
MERLLPVWQVLGGDRNCFARKEMCEESWSSRIQWEVETDEVILQQWQKQIDYGKCTPGYQCFLHQVLKALRQPGLHPETPNKNGRFSHHSWDTHIRQWRRALHSWDPPSQPLQGRKAEGCVFYSWQGMESLLEPMDSTPLDDLLDDWLQALEPSEYGWRVSFAEIHWSRVTDGVWPTWWLLPPPLPGSVRKIPATGSTFQLITAIYLSQS